MTLLYICFLVLLASSWIPLVFSTPISTTKLCDEHISLAISNVAIDEDGSILDNEGGILYPPGTHWSNPGEEGVHNVCPCNITERPCLRKCCPMGQSMTNQIKCFDHDHNFEFEVREQNESKTVDGKKHFALLFGNPCPHGCFYLEPDLYVQEEFWIRSSDGMVVMPHEDMYEFGPNNFCLDYYPKKGLHLPAICLELRKYVDVDVILTQKENNSERLVYKIYPILMIISTFFLLATFLVYALIPELRNLHGKCLMSHVGSLAISYIFLSIVQIGGMNISDGLCQASAYVFEFAFLASIFWLNSMCFDICITFCDMRPKPESFKKVGAKKFTMYSAYSWGVPGCILIISLIMDYVPGIPDNNLKPRFGRSKCWFESKIEALTYFYGPVAVLTVSNIIMFIITAVKIMQVNKQTDIVKKASSRKNKENRLRFNLYLKLSLVMDVNWIMEVVSWAIGGPDYLWYITDIGNILRGIFIFVIFVCKNDIRKVVMKKAWPSKTDGSQTNFMSRIWRPGRGSSPRKSTSGLTAPVPSPSCTGGNIKIRGQSSASGVKIYE